MTKTETTYFQTALAETNEVYDALEKFLVKIADAHESEMENLYGALLYLSKHTASARAALMHMQTAPHK